MCLITALILLMRLIYMARTPLDAADMAAIDAVFPADAVVGTRYPEQAMSLLAR